MIASKRRPAKKYRSVWISDVHLGFRGCSAEVLLDFLTSVECERLYLVGDIIDMWSMKRRPYWPQSHNNVVRAILGKAKHGTEVTFIPGNHDELLRSYDGMHFGNVRIVHEALHVGADGRRFIVLHGDKFDGVVRCSNLVALVGHELYDIVLRISGWLNVVRRHFGWPHWSLSAYLKYRVKNAVQYISNFEEVVAFEARRLGVDGVVCGHIHHPEIRDIEGLVYCNSGDWVESCSALVEHPDGALEILRWTQSEQSPRPLKAAA